MGANLSIFALCAEFLKENGFDDVFDDVRVTLESGDPNVDILATKDSAKCAVQCKNYTLPLRNTPLQEVNASKTFYNCCIAAVMTNLSFAQGVNRPGKTIAVFTSGLR